MVAAISNALTIAKAPPSLSPVLGSPLLLLVPFSEQFMLPFFVTYSLRHFKLDNATHGFDLLSDAGQAAHH